MVRINIEEPLDVNLDVILQTQENWTKDFQGIIHHKAFNLLSEQIPVFLTVDIPEVLALSHVQGNKKGTTIILFNIVLIDVVMVRKVEVLFSMASDVINITETWVLASTRKDKALLEVPLIQIQTITKSKKVEPIKKYC